MGDFTLDTTTTPSVLIRTRGDDGATVDYHFEVAPLTKLRLDAVAQVGKRMRKLQEKAVAGTATDADQAAAAEALAAVLDQRVRSTNGPVTISELWESGRLGFEHMQQLLLRVNEETAGPPA